MANETLAKEPRSAVQPNPVEDLWTSHPDQPLNEVEVESLRQHLASTMKEEGSSENSVADTMLGVLLWGALAAAVSGALFLMWAAARSIGGWGKF